MQWQSPAKADCAVTTLVIVHVTLACVIWVRRLAARAADLGMPENAAVPLKLEARAGRAGWPKKAVRRAAACSGKEGPQTRSNKGSTCVLMMCTGRQKVKGALASSSKCKTTGLGAG